MDMKKICQNMQVRILIPQKQWRFLPRPYRSVRRHSLLEQSRSERLQIRNYCIWASDGVVLSGGVLNKMHLEKRQLKYFGSPPLGNKTQCDIELLGASFKLTRKERKQRS